MSASVVTSYKNYFVRTVDVNEDGDGKLEFAINRELGFVGTTLHSLAFTVQRHLTESNQFISPNVFEHAVIKRHGGQGWVEFSPLATYDTRKLVITTNGQIFYSDGADFFQTLAPPPWSKKNRPIAAMLDSLGDQATRPDGVAFFRSGLFEGLKTLRAVTPTK